MREGEPDISNDSRMILCLCYILLRELDRELAQAKAGYRPEIEQREKVKKLALRVIQYPFTDELP
jgi:hypothetical protein